jgi:NAD(P)-dependent dehydrogenase (short-subunit alcohol dehydrogenase family)
LIFFFKSLAFLSLKYLRAKTRQELTELSFAFLSSSPEETYDCFNTNVLGLLNATRAILPYMRAQRSGTVALFGSLGSWSGAPGAGIYCATKWAVSGLAESLRLDVADFGIRVCVIEPGYFRTGFLNAGARVRTERRIEDYEGSAVGKTRAMLDQYDEKQPGDLEKGAKVIVDCFERGDGEGGVPLRLVLGSDCRAAIEDKCRSTLEYLEENKVVIDGTDYADGE